MTHTPIDGPTLDALKAATGADFVRELVDTFLADAPDMIAQLHHALASGDAATFRRTAHSLKSNANTFGAQALGERAKALELGGLDPVRAAGGAPLADLEREFARAAVALKEAAHG
jgi:HPt (histidine-containing phosphotransfer) domain-containing protein